MCVLFAIVNDVHLTTNLMSANNDITYTSTRYLSFQHNLLSYCYNVHNVFTRNIIYPCMCRYCAGTAGVVCEHTLMLEVPHLLCIDMQFTTIVKLF